MPTLESLLLPDPYRQSIRRLELMIADINGKIRGKILQLQDNSDLECKKVFMPPSLFACDFCGENIEESGLIWQKGDPDYPCQLDLDTLSLVPWQTNTAQVMLQMHNPEGTPVAYDPRAIVQRIVERFAAQGLKPIAAVELEFTLSHSPQQPQSATLPYSQSPDMRAGLYDVGKLEPYQSLFDNILHFARQMHLPADTIIAEAAPNQFEINLQHIDNPVRAADHALLLKRLIKAVAKQHDMTASFMAKPYADAPGNGMHIHLSLCDQDGRNVFADKPDALLSAIGGLQQTLPATMAMMLPNANSFKRVAPRTYAPRTAHWGYNNRNVGLRIPTGSATATRIEHRYAGADANPYNVMASLLAGIDYGLSNKCPASVPTSGEISDNPALNLPTTPESALQHFRKSVFIDDYFGGDFQRIYTACHHAEIQRYQRMIMPIEYDWFLEMA